MSMDASACDRVTRTLRLSRLPCIQGPGFYTIQFLYKVLGVTADISVDGFTSTGDHKLKPQGTHDDTEALLLCFTLCWVED